MIELLMAVAVIGVLVGIVFVAVGPIREKAKDARIKSDLVLLQNRAEQIYLDEGEYDLVCAEATCDAEIQNLYDDMNKYGGPAGVFNASSEYCAYSPLISSPGDYFCIDSRGFVGIIPSPVVCEIHKMCGFAACPDFNDNEIVDCGCNDPPTCDDPITESCPASGDPEFAGSDIACVLQCSGITRDPPSPPGPACGVDPCPACSGIEECLSIYDVSGDGAISVLVDVLKVLEKVGQGCD